MKMPRDSVWDDKGQIPMREGHSAMNASRSKAQFVWLFVAIGQISAGIAAYVFFGFQHRPRHQSNRNKTEILRSGSHLPHRFPC